MKIRTTIEVEFELFPEEDDEKEITFIALCRPCGEPLGIGTDISIMGPGIQIHLELHARAKANRLKVPSQRCVDYILEKIEQGELKSGDTVERSKDLMSKLNISINSVQAARDLLKKKGILEVGYFGGDKMQGMVTKVV